MRVTSRDLKLIHDIALSHLLSRDQIIRLDYFGSVTRTNTRLRALAGIGLVKRLETPFFSQSLYMAGPMAHQVVNERISKLIEGRTGSPRFVRHALSVTEARITLIRNGGEWRFEPQLHRVLREGKEYQIRPDGLLLTSSIPVFVEVDLGHVAPAKFREKLLGYHLLATSGRCFDLYGMRSFRLLTLTTGSLRSRRLRSLLPQPPGFEFLCQTFEEAGVRPIPTWS